MSDAHPGAASEARSPSLRRSRRRRARDDCLRARRSRRRRSGSWRSVGTVPRGERHAFMSLLAGSRRPYQPDWPVNQMRPLRSKVAVLRFAPRASSGSGQDLTARVFGFDAHDRVHSTVGDPRRAVRTDDDTVRRGPRTERHLLHLARRRIQDAERAVTLAGVVDGPARWGEAATSCGPRRDDVGVDGCADAAPGITQPSVRTSAASAPARATIGEVSTIAGSRKVIEESYSTGPECSVRTKNHARTCPMCEIELLELRRLIGTQAKPGIAGLFNDSQCAYSPSWTSPRAGAKHCNRRSGARYHIAPVGNHDLDAAVQLPAGRRVVARDRICRAVAVAR